MKNVWHVYVDEIYKKVIPFDVDRSKLPFADVFSQMRLFETKKGAVKYIDSELKKIGKRLSYLGDVEGMALEATDGGEFRRGICLYEQRPNSSRRLTRSIWFEAVQRTVHK